MTLADTVARLAVQLARSAPADWTVAEIARDAIRAARLAHAARRRLARQQPADRQFSDLAPLVARYGAEVVRTGDVNGMVVGLSFRNGTHTSGFRNIFFVS